MKKLKPTKQPDPNARKIIVTFKVNSEEMRNLLAKSHAYCEGNVSEWIRYASFNFAPSKKDYSK